MTKFLIATTALVGALAGTAQAETIGVSIPAATHGWAGALNFHAERTIERLEEVYPDHDFVLATTPESATQVSDLEDMVATRGIDALVVLPFESEPLTGPIQRIADSRTWVTVVDRIRNGAATVPVNVTYPPSMISTAIEMTAVGVTGAAPMSGEFIIASELITPENADDFYFEDSPY